MNDDHHSVDAATDAAETGTYEVGYGRPPVSGRIKPGEVRNPRGPRRGARSFKNDVRDVLAMPVPMTSADGKVRRISTRRANLMKLREKALKGDARAIDRLIELARQYDEDEGLVASTASLLVEDEEILANAREHDRQLLLANTPTTVSTDPQTTDDGDKQ